MDNGFDIINEFDNDHKITHGDRMKPFNKISMEHGGVKVGMRLKLKDNRMVEVKGIVHFPTKYIVDDGEKEFQIFTHEVMIEND